MDRSKFQTHVCSNNSGSSVSVHGDIQGSGFKQSYNYPKRNNNTKRYRYYKYLPAIVSLFFACPSYAETVGGVSATASPVANSSGSVTNQAIQVLQGPYITNTYGGGIQCQGPTLNITPFVTGSGSFQAPYEPYYNDPVYDMRDLDEDGSLDNPGDILYFVPTRTGQKDSYNLSLGVSATWSNPMDKELQELCKNAATTQIAMQQQLTANKRLDFEIARLKNCGELIKAGIMFRPGTQYAAICQDVMVTNPGGVIPQHVHSIPSPSVSESRATGSAVDLGGPLQIRQ